MSASSTSVTAMPKCSTVPTYVEANSGIVGNRLYEMHQRYLDALSETDKPFRQDIEDELVCMLVNMGKKYKIDNPLIQQLEDGWRGIPRQPPKLI